MKLSILDLAGDQAVLSGVQAGRQLLGKLVAAARPPAEPEPVYLDFDGVTVATASFLREGVIAFRDHVRATLPGLYPVIANASPAVTEELDFSAASQGCDVDLQPDADGRGARSQDSG